VAGPVGITALAVAVGLAGAKGGYVVLHRGRRSGGWALQAGILLGGLLAIGLGAAVYPLARAGVYFNVAAPGVLLGLAIGRPGCVLAGCCAGRPTSSRWGMWSSDGRLGIRRIPAQLLEALLALVVGLAALAVVVLAGPGRPGAVFIGALAAYTLGRQFLLPLRAESRRTRSGRLVTIAVAALALVAAVIIAVAG
jgi:phosphatidylglycerol:prolipoprotein diacylglycerol transferase